MQKQLFIFLLSAFSTCAFAQKGYTDSLQRYQEQYVKNHEVVKGADKAYLQFFTVQENYKVVAAIERKEASPWFLMETSGTQKKMYRVYAVAHFTIGDTAVQLNIYQSQTLMQTDEYKDHLFLPFTDATSGEESYSSGRYIDLSITDIKNNQLVLDFNKAYNPYCAYVSGKYNCPIPPKENRLDVAIPAGEKVFTKSH
jgi:uncharacterized protein